MSEEKHAETIAVPTVEAAVEQVLERMCFTTIMGPVDSIAAQRALQTAARVEFRGPTDGWLQVGCSGTAAEALASNFSGAKVGEEEISQFVLELANMLCGVVVSSFEAHGQYDLSTPQAVGPETLMDPEGARVDVELEEGVLSVVVHQA